MVVSGKTSKDIVRRLPGNVESRPRRVGPRDDEPGAVDPVASPFLKAMNIEQT